jgi:hypothetical protein
MQWTAPSDEAMTIINPNAPAQATLMPAIETLLPEGTHNLLLDAKDQWRDGFVLMLVRWQATPSGAEPLIIIQTDAPAADIVEAILTDEGRPVAWSATNSKGVATYLHAKSGLMWGAIDTHVIGIASHEQFSALQRPRLRLRPRALPELEDYHTTMPAVWMRGTQLPSAWSWISTTTIPWQLRIDAGDAQRVVATLDVADSEARAALVDEINGLVAMTLLKQPRPAWLTPLLRSITVSTVQRGIRVTATVPATTLMHLLGGH